MPQNDAKPEDGSILLVTWQRRLLGDVDDMFWMNAKKKLMPHLYRLTWDVVLLWAGLGLGV